MLTEAQKALRLTGITASEVGAVAGLSPYARPLDVWLVKRGLAEVPETDAMRLGTALEPVVADLYAREYVGHGERIATPAEVWPESEGGTLRHSEEPWIIATPDRVVFSYADGIPGAYDARLVEIKTVSHRSAHHWGEAHDDVPPWYRAQVEWQMLVTGVEACDLVALIGGAELRVYRLTRDEELAAMLVDVARAFWRHVVEGTEPPIDGSESWRAYLEQRFRGGRGALLAATRAADEIAERLADARDRRVAAERDEELAANEMRALIGDADGVQGEGWRATWRTGAKGSPKWRDIACALGADARPELITQHTAAPTRRFTFTKGK